MGNCGGKPEPEKAPASKPAPAPSPTPSSAPSPAPTPAPTPAPAAAELGQIELKVEGEASPPAAEAAKAAQGERLAKLSTPTKSPGNGGAAATASGRREGGGAEALAMLDPQTQSAKQMSIVIAEYMGLENPRDMKPVKVLLAAKAAVESACGAKATPAKPPGDGAVKQQLKAAADRLLEIERAQAPDSKAGKLGSLAAQKVKEANFKQATKSREELASFAAQKVKEANFKEATKTREELASFAAQKVKEANFKQATKTRESLASFGVRSVAASNRQAAVGGGDGNADDAQLAAALVSAAIAGAMSRQASSS
jgi:hypothetical protein